MKGVSRVVNGTGGAPAHDGGDDGVLCCEWPYQAGVGCRFALQLSCSADRRTLVHLPGTNRRVRGTREEVCDDHVDLSYVLLDCLICDLTVLYVPCST